MHNSQVYPKKDSKEDVMNGRASVPSGKTINDLWVEEIERLRAFDDDELTPFVDESLKVFLKKLSDLRTDLISSKESRDGQRHSEAAIGACRTTRRIRFLIRSPNFLDHESRSAILNEMRPTLEAIDVTLEIADSKPEHPLNLICRNIRERIGWIEDGHKSLRHS